MKKLLLSIFLSFNLSARSIVRSPGLYVLNKGHGKATFIREKSPFIKVNVYLYSPDGLVITARSFDGKFEYKEVMNMIPDLGDQWMELLNNSKDGTIKELQMGKNYLYVYYRVEVVSLKQTHKI